MIPLLLIGILGFSPQAGEEDAGAAPALTDQDWPAMRAERRHTIKKYLHTASSGYSWFAHAMHGKGAGTPYLFLRALPELAPDLWGPPQERYARFGFFEDPDDPDRPLPLGLGWVLDPVQGDHAARAYHTVTLTCAACHVGRVETAPGQFETLVGAPNTQIDVRRFRRALELSTDRLLSSDQKIAETARKLGEILRSKDRAYFFGGRYHIDADAEDQERKRFEDPVFAAKVLGDFARRVQVGRAAVKKQLQTSYSRRDAPPLDGGSPGQSDGSGDLIPKFLVIRELAHGSPTDALTRFLGTEYPEMPIDATVTDNLSVWMQKYRPYGQLDGSINEPIYRNVAAETAVVGSPRDINLRNADIAARFTAALPAPRYPFAVDMMRARRGRTVFLNHCAVCHRSGNKTVYRPDVIGTDPNRARVLSKEGRDLLLTNFRLAFTLNDKDYLATRANGTQFRPADLQPDEIVNDRVRLDNQGYVAGLLDGIWARAPYLHNGSVPTLRHLLAPNNPESHRPEAFVRGVVRYDTFNIGFDWDPRVVGASLADSPTAVIFDTRWDAASNHGHDQDIRVDEQGKPDPKGPLRRLDWSGPEHRSDLEDLLEYLKTL